MTDRKNLDDYPIFQMGARVFTELMDCPSVYTSFAGYKVVVRGDEKGLEFVPDTGGANLPDLWTPTNDVAEVQAILTHTQYFVTLDSPYIVSATPGNSGFAYSDQTLTNNAQKRGFAVTFTPTSIPNEQGVYIGILNSDIFDNATSGAAVALLKTPVVDEYVVMLGNPFQDDLQAAPTNLVYTGQELLVAINNTGLIEFYVDGVLFFSMTSLFPVADALVSMLVGIQNDGGCTVSVIENPILPTGVLQHTQLIEGALILPTNPERKTYLISGLTADGKFINSGVDTVFNGDFVSFNENGIPTGKTVGIANICDTFWTPLESIVVGDVKFISQNGGTIFNNGFSCSGNGGNNFLTENSLNPAANKQGLYFKASVDDIVSIGEQFMFIGYGDSVSLPPVESRALTISKTNGTPATQGYIEIDFANNPQVISNGGQIPLGTIVSTGSAGMWQYGYNNLGFTVTIDGIQSSTLFVSLGHIMFDPGNMKTWSQFISALDFQCQTMGASATLAPSGFAIRITSNTFGASSTALTADAGANYLWTWGSGIIQSPVNGNALQAPIPLSYTLGQIPQLGGTDYSSGSLELIANNLTEFCIAIDTTTPNGNVYLYADGTLIDTHSFANPALALTDMFLVYLGSSDTLTVELIPTPVNPVSGVSQYKTSSAGGIVDVNSYPLYRQNRSYEAKDMVIPLMSLKGLIGNGNGVIFNSLGEIMTVLK